MLNTNLNKEREMITLTDKETLLAQELINNNDGTDAHICNSEFIDIESLKFSIETLKGVFGSLVQKGLLDYDDNNDNGEIYRWTIPVDAEVQSQGCNLIYNNKPFKPFGNSEDWFYGKEIKINTIEKFLDLLNEFNIKQKQHKAGKWEYI
tara:strand:- start:402 stop:851 length:450 start_codon:yes stop_codon:yes gene_type:complete